MPDELVAAAPAVAAPEEGSYAERFSEMMSMELLESESVQSDIRDVLAAHYAAYRLSADLEELPYDEHVRLPLARSATDDNVARFAGPFILERTPVRVSAVPGTDPEAAQANEALLNRQWRDKRLLNGKKVVFKAAKIAYGCGSAYVFADWVQERRMRFGVGMLKDESLDLDGPRWRIIHPYDVYPDPRADDVCNMRYLWIREELSLKEFDRRVASGMYPKATADAIEAIRRSAGIQSGTVAGVSTQDRFSLPAATGNPAPSDADTMMTVEGDRPVYLFHRFDREKWCIGSVTQDLIGEVPNPAPDGEIPVRVCMPNPDLQGPNGVPMSEASHEMNKHANSIASAYLEVVRRAGSPTMLMREGDQDSIQPADITGAMYEILTVPDVERSMRPLEKGIESAQINLQGADWFKQKSEVGSKSGDYRTGIDAAGAPGTATGTQAFDAQADRQFSIPFSFFSDFIDDLLGLTLLYNQAFLEKSQWLKRIGSQGAYARTYEVSRPMLEGEFEVSTTAAVGMGDPQAAQGIAALKNTFGDVPGILNLPYLALQYAKAVRIPNPEKAVPAFIRDPIPVEVAIDMVKLGLPVPPHPADDHMDFADAFGEAAMQAMDEGNEEEAQLLARAAQERMMIAGMLPGIGAPGPGQDVGNPDGSKASDKGRKVPGGRVVQGPGASPGPAAPPGRDLRAAGGA